MAATALTVILAGLPLAGCSVPREADELTSGALASPARSTTVAPPSISTAAPSPSASRSVSAAAASSPTPTPTPTASQAPVRAPVPHQVAGYALSAPPPSLGDPLGAVRGAGDLFAAASARSVAQGATPVGVLLLLALRPEYVGDRTVEPQVVPKVVAGLTSGGVTPTYQTWGGVRVAVASGASSGTIVVWCTGGVLGVVVGGGDPALVTGYARAYLAAR